MTLALATVELVPIVTLAVGVSRSLAVSKSLWTVSCILADAPVARLSATIVTGSAEAIAGAASTTTRPTAARTTRSNCSVMCG